MRTLWFVPLAGLCLAAAPSPAPAQTASQPTIVVTILAGAVTGHELWTIPRQQLCVLNSSGSCTGVYDTLRLARAVGSSLALGATASYFPWPAVGFHAEISYLGLPFDDGCNPIFLNPDAENKHQQLCDNLRSAKGSGGAIAIFVGALLRATPRRAVSPYVRASIGIVHQSRSTVEVVGSYVDASGFRERQLIFDQDARQTVPMVGLAVGITTPIGPGYQFRLEARDIVASLDRITGPASDLAVAPIGSRYYHHVALIFGLDIVLERQRGRRY